MDADLYDDLFERLCDADLPADVVRLIEACWSGDQALDDALADASEATTQPRTQRPKPTAAVFLSSIEVRGFRGIAETSKLTVDPGPGLTLVVGRNGSGKSSFAEAAELALTGVCKRWEGKSAEWQRGWRNLHAKHASLIRCGFSVEGAGETTVTLRWKDGDELEAMQRSVEQAGEAVAWDGLGWAGPVQTHRPFLSYAELGAVAERPSGLYDELEGILGLEAVASARKRLAARKKALAEAVKGCDAGRKQLLERLSGLEDPRAAECVALLEVKGSPDLEALSRILTGGEEGTGSEVIAALQGIAQLRAPDVERVGTLVDALRQAAAIHEEATTARAGQANALAGILGQALELTRSESHDGACPVCTAPLASSWREEAEARLAEAKALAKGLADAKAGLDQATRSLRAEIRGVPPVLEKAIEGLDVASLWAKWKAWAEAPEVTGDPRGLAEHAEQQVLELADATRELQAKASELREQLADAWAPVAERLGGWIASARAVEPTRPKVGALKKAEAWMKAIEGTLRTQRFEPIQRRAMEVWEMLRQSSSVSLDSLELTGSGNRRKVELGVSVDEQDSVALSVMSQGELNALGLSLFLPQMEQPGSPFRFVVVDDPVQAMDLDKVDGLARVLDSVAKTRQVVVFTHDDRLPEAVERLRIPARVVSVHRRARSEVEARESQQTSERHFDDAYAVMKSEQEVVVAELVPAFCRYGIEAACRRRVQRDRLGRGDPHEDVARALAEVTTTQQLMALALLGDGSKGSEVYARLKNGVGKDAVDAMQRSSRRSP